MNLFASVQLPTSVKGVVAACLLTALGMSNACAQVSLPSSGLIAAKPSDSAFSASDLDSAATLNKSPGIQAALASYSNGTKTCLDKGEVLVVHFAKWTTNDSGSFTLGPNLWNFYHGSLAGQKCIYSIAKLKPNGQDPLLYRDSKGILLGIDIFDKPAVVTIGYKVSATPDVAENVANAGAIIQAFLGATGGMSGGGTPKEAAAKAAYVAIGTLPGYKSLPFDFNISYTLLPPSSNNANAQGAPSAPLHPTMPAGTVGVPYSHVIDYTAGVGQKTFAALAGNHPPAGLTIESAGVLDGTPVTPSSGAFVVKITDSGNPSTSVNQTYSITINPAGGPVGGAANGPAAPNPKGANTVAQSNNPQGNSASKANPTSVDCAAVTNQAPCTYSLSYRADDLEWWDLGMSVSAPGVKESTYSVVSGVVSKAKTTHTDVYVLLDLYPGAYWKPKTSFIPHFDVGLPIAGKTFYRPAFGIAENVTSWTGLERRKFPLQMSLVGGVVYMEEHIPRSLQVGSSATAAQLTADLQEKRVTKAWFGVELSVNSLVGKIKK
jgi:hypothetical protein